MFISTKIEGFSVESKPSSDEQPANKKIKIEAK
jgi:hypothetical protein